MRHVHELWLVYRDSLERHDRLDPRFRRLATITLRHVQEAWLDAIDRELTRCYPWLT